MAPLTPSNTIRIISVPKVTPIQTGTTSFSNMLAMEKTVDALFANGGLAKYEVPRAAVPHRVLKPGFEDATTYKLPVSALLPGSASKGSLYAVRLQGPNQDYFALYTPQAHRLAVRQKSGLPEGFSWSNYQVR